MTAVTKMTANSLYSKKSVTTVIAVTKLRKEVRLNTEKELDTLLAHVLGDDGGGVDD